MFRTPYVINTRGFVEKTIEFNMFIEISLMSSTQQINTGGFVEKQQCTRQQ